MVGTEHGAASPAMSTRWSLIALLLLTACYSLAFVDRQILNLMIEPMKRDFGITDAQAGFILGPAFSITYTGLGLFAGFCADRFSRRNLLLGAGVLWSVGSVATAFAHDYQSMILTRMMVGASEAFLFPAGMSMVADLFPPRRLPAATTTFLISPYLGGGLSLILGGMILGQTSHLGALALPPIGTMRGWQITLAIVGILGLLPVLALLLIREPSRQSPEAGGDGERRFGFFEGVAYMARRWRFFAMYFLGMAAVSLMLNTVPAWAPTLLTRKFGMNPAEVGAQYGGMVLVFGLAGAICSPFVNGWLARRYADCPMRTALMGPLLVALAGAALLFAQGRVSVLVCLALITFGYASCLPMAGSSLQLATPPLLRGEAAAFYFVIVGILAMGVGPMLVPLTTEYVLHDPRMIGEALGIISILFGLSAFALLSVALHGFRVERGIAAEDVRRSAPLPASA